MARIAPKDGVGPISWKPNETHWSLRRVVRNPDDQDEHPEATGPQVTRRQSSSAHAFAHKMAREAQGGHSQPVGPSIEQPESKGGPEAGLDGVRGSHRAAHEPIHEGGDEARGTGHLVRVHARDAGAHESLGVPEAVKEGAFQIKLSARPQKIVPEMGFPSEMIQELVKIEDLRQTAPEVSVLKQVSGRVQDHMGRTQHLKRGRLQINGAGEEQAWIGMEAPALREDRVMNVDDGPPVAVPKRRQLVHPLAVIPLIVRVQIDRFPSVLRQGCLHGCQLLPRDHNVHIRAEPAFRHRQSPHQIGGAFEQDDGRPRRSEGLSDSVHLPAQDPRILGGQRACRLQVRAHLAGERIQRHSLGCDHREPRQRSRHP